MRYQHVVIESIGYELAPHVVTSADLEDRLAPALAALRMPRGQIEMLTGIRERRYWNPGQTMADGAARAARKALARSAVKPDQIDLLVYGGVCRDHLEPATACAVADALNLSGHVQVFDIANACLGVMNGIVQVANAIELGQARAGLVVACESARQIVDLTIDRLNARPDLDTFKLHVATMTGGSGAIGVVVASDALAPTGHRLHGGVIRSAAEHHRLCRWGPDTGIPASAPMVMETDAAAVLEHGVALGQATWRDFLVEMDWTDRRPDRTICHQVGAWHRDTVLKAIGMPPEKDFKTFDYLGNIGTVSLPITAAIAAERGVLQPGDRIAMLGIGSGLNCLMLGATW